MTNAEMNKQLTEAMRDFSAAYTVLKVTIDRYEQETGTSVNDLKDFVSKYPFDKSFDELDVGQWVANVVEGLRQPNYKVFDYQYLNTGGNTMVGIHRVWLTEEKKVVYVYTNEEGSTISTVDYIRDDIPIDDYDEFMMDAVDWGRITGYEKYFELYRYCYNQYLADDCKYFGITCGVQYHLLSDELQKAVTTDYLVWLESESDGLIRTDGKCIILDPDYENTTEEDKQLEAIKEFKRWHDTIAGVEKYYEEEYTLTFAGHTVKLPFYAEVWDAVDCLLERTIKDW